MVRFGIAILGRMDEFSSHMIWLEAVRTNNDPLVVNSRAYSVKLSGD